ncbi:MAG: hypothetical protein M3457_16640 [Chloroflexota bacterium]|nr:hypothetical protein [Chloroflexota bacterium]
MSDEEQLPEKRGNAASYDVPAALTRRLREPSDEQSPPVTYRENPQGEWIPERAEADRKDRQAAHKQQLEAENARHRREQDAKDADVRRRAIYAIELLIAATFVVCFLVALFSDNADRQEWAQNIIALLLTSVLSAAAGWFAKGSGK